MRWRMHTNIGDGIERWELKERKKSCEIEFPATKTGDGTTESLCMPGKPFFALCALVYILLQPEAFICWTCTLKLEVLHTYDITIGKYRYVVLYNTS